MRSLYKFLFLVFLSCLLSGKSVAQGLKFDETIACFGSPEYPGCLFDMLDTKGFIRIDKEYFGQCERVVYYHDAGGNPSFFVNPTLCRKGAISEIYPVYSKSELELQFQKRARPHFESLSAAIRKQCKPLAFPNGTIPGPKSKTTVRAYKHEASNSIIVIKNTAPVAYIYLLK